MLSSNRKTDMMSVLLGVQLAVYTFVGALPGGFSVLTPLTAVRAQLATTKAELMFQLAPMWGRQMGVVMPMSSCPSGSQASSNGIIQSLHNLNNFIFLFGWTIVPGGFVLGLILYFYGWDENWKKRGRKLMVGAVVIAGGILLWGAIASLISWVTGGGCAPTT